MITKQSQTLKTIRASADIELNSELKIMHDTLNLFCLVPHSDVTQILIWACREVKLEGKSKHIVNTAQEVKTTLHL